MWIISGNQFFGTVCKVFYSYGYMDKNHYWSVFMLWAHRYETFDEAEKQGKEGVRRGNITSYAAILVDKFGKELSPEEAINQRHLEKLGKNHVMDCAGQQSDQKS